MFIEEATNTFLQTSFTSDKLSLAVAYKNNYFT